MSLVSIVNLAERLLNHSDAQTGDTRPEPNTAHHADEGTQPRAEDQFTPSTKASQEQTTAKDAGLFRVTQFSFFSAAANFFLGQNSAPPNAATPASAANPPAANASNQNGDGAPASRAVANAAPASGATVPALPVALANTSTEQPAPGSSAIQEQLLSLNQSLSVLGLTPREIQQVDQIASIINDFNPQAFISLAYQLEALAQQQSGTQNGATGVTNVQPPSANANPANPTSASATGNTFQLQELVIKFADVQAETNASGTAQGAAGSGNATAQASAFSLQIEEVNLTLVKGDGTTTQIQAPAKQTTTASGNSSASVASTKPRAAGA